MTLPVRDLTAYLATKGAKLKRNLNIQGKDYFAQITSIPQSSTCLPTRLHCAIIEGGYGYPERSPVIMLCDAGFIPLGWYSTDQMYIGALALVD